MERQLRRLSAVMLGCALVLAGASACTGSGDHPAKLAPEQRAAGAYLSAYGRADATVAAARTSDPQAAATALRRTLDGLGSGARGTFQVAKSTRSTDTRATVRYSARWRLPGATASWQYRGSLPMVKTAAGWRVRWAAGDIYPGLRAGTHLATVRTQPARAPLLDSDGKALFSKQPVVDVGINPADVKDLPALAHTLATVLHVSQADIVSSVKAAPLLQFVPVITLRRAAYEQVRAKIHDLPGTQFRTGSELLGPTTRFAQPLLGRVGQATKELIDGSKGAIAAGDLTGLSGLQLALNAQLAGTDGLSVITASDADGSTISTVARVSAPKPGTAVRLTLDRDTQNAADAALSAISAQAAIVATQPSTGKILAVANTAATDGDIALAGHFPPGSTFKIVTYTAAFTNDRALTPETPAACPASITVNGQQIHNENSFDKGTVSLADAFAFSCNTTAARLGLQLPSGALVKAARSLGLGAAWQLPVPAFSGSLPEPAGPAARNEQAADAYGQGKVLVSPLLMAEIAGAAATGRPVAPSLVVGKRASPGAAQPARVTGYLNTLMRDVVTMPGATGRVLNGLPGKIKGKTGTAEFGTRKPPRSHSWFAGTRGDLAFAVFVYGGGDTGPSGATVARMLLTTLGPAG
jgi:cell division protein FtsI/penicillin-binding protein 2